MKEPFIYIFITEDKNREYNKLESTYLTFSREIIDEDDWDIEE